MKIQFSQRSYEDSGETSLLQDIEKTKCALEIAYSGFDTVTDPDLIDSYIYEVIAVQMRYKYLLQQAAKLNMLPAEDLCEKPAIPSLVV